MIQKRTTDAKTDTLKTKKHPLSRAPTTTQRVFSSKSLMGEAATTKDGFIFVGTYNDATRLDRQISCELETTQQKRREQVLGSFPLHTNQKNNNIYKLEQPLDTGKRALQVTDLPLLRKMRYGLVSHWQMGGKPAGFRKSASGIFR